MSSYVLVFRGRTGRTPTAEEEARWPEWFERIGSSISDFGNRVGQSRLTVNEGEQSHSPSGYIVINAESLDAAVELATGCPIHVQGGYVEVGEVVAS